MIDQHTKKPKTIDKHKTQSCWVVTDGRTGIENQALGLAEAIARLTPLDITIKRINITTTFKNLPHIFWGNPFHRLTDRHTLAPPFPDLWIGCGSLSIPFAKFMKKNNPNTYIVQCQSPRAPLSFFDIIIPPVHDRLEGNNVHAITGSPNRITPEKIDHAHQILKPVVTHLTGTRVAIIIGGDSKHYKLTGAGLDKIISHLQNLQKAGYGLIISTSRRTGIHNTRLLRENLAPANCFFIEDAPETIKPFGYCGMLGLVDHIITTPDSTNMITEAATTGKPIHVLPLPGSSEKFARFHKALRDTGITRPYLSPNLEQWRYIPLDETAKAANIVHTHWIEC